MCLIAYFEINFTVRNFFACKKLVKNGIFLNLRSIQVKSITILLKIFILGLKICYNKVRLCRIFNKIIYIY
jgi:hypothetical protein